MPIFCLKFSKNTINNDFHLIFTFNNCVNSKPTSSSQHGKRHHMSLPLLWKLSLFVSLYRYGSRIMQTLLYIFHETWWKDRILAKKEPDTFCHGTGQSAGCNDFLRNNAGISGFQPVDSNQQVDL